MEKIYKNKRVKFIELANARVNRAIKDLQLIGNLANKRAYEYSEKDARQIVRALEAEIERIKDRYKSGSEKTNNVFNLE
jgi:predicted DNA binding CopG/RHH family protein